MPFNRLPHRDPRTIARDIPGVLDVLFPRLSGGLVTSLNKKTYSFKGLEAISNELIERSTLQKAMLFEISMARAEAILSGDQRPDWNKCLQIASKRQQRHYDAKIPTYLDSNDCEIAAHASFNLVEMLNNLKTRYPNAPLEKSPVIPGLGWISSGNGDFSLGRVLIEVKHTNRNFVSGDFRQILMYFLLKYANCIEIDEEVWTEAVLLNPRRNTALSFNFDWLLLSASANSNRVELSELLRSMVCQEADLL